MVHTFHCAHSHPEMQLSDTYTIIDTDPMPPKMADTDMRIWYQCRPNNDMHNSYLHAILLIYLLKIIYYSSCCFI